MLLEVKNLLISFDWHPVVDNVSFSLKKGERFGLIGESGSGKTLSALAIAGLLPDNAKIDGEILINNQILPKNDKQMAKLRSENIGMIFQEPMSSLNPLMKIDRQIGEALKIKHDDSKIDEKIDFLLKEVGLDEEYKNRYPHQISGGQRQRIMIAIALALEPKLLICDEPTSALDLINQDKILSLLDKICEQRNMGLLFISHDLAAVARLCQNVGVLKKGRLVEIGAAKEVFNKPKHEYSKKLLKAAKINVPKLVEFETRKKLFEAKNITKIFKRGEWLNFSQKQNILAVNNVSFTINSSESVALVGPSGCGKTTLARLIAGLDRANEGEFCIENNKYGWQKKLPNNIRREISLVFQDPFGSFNPRLKIGASIGEPLRLIKKLNPIEKQNRIIKAVEAVGLDKNMLERFPHEFSGGQRQRLAIARALVIRPKLVVLDEPVSALDVSVRGQILELLNKLRSEFGLSYLLISHDLEMVRAVSDRIMVMNKGRIIEQNNPKNLFNNPQNEITKQLLAARIILN